MNLSPVNGGELSLVRGILTAREKPLIGGGASLPSKEATLMTSTHCMVVEGSCSSGKNGRSSLPKISIHSAYPDPSLAAQLVEKSVRDTCTCIYSREQCPTGDTESRQLLFFQKQS